MYGKLDRDWGDFERRFADLDFDNRILTIPEIRMIYEHIREDGYTSLLWISNNIAYVNAPPVLLLHELLHIFPVMALRVTNH